MKNFFDNFHGLERGETIELGLNRVVQLQAQNIQKSIRYYNESFVPVDMTNPLVRLCYRFNWDLTSEHISYYNKANELLQELALGVGLTSSENRGDIFKGLFYGDEVLTVMCSEANPQLRNTILSQASWKQIRPVRVLARPGVKGAYIRPDLINYDKGYCVISVDIPALAYMFRGWIKDNLALPPEQQKRPEHFVAQYILPSMMWSQMDVIMLNSLVIGPEAWKEDRAEFTKVLAFNQHTDSLIKTLYGLTKEVGMHNATWEKLLSHIPSFNGIDASTNLPFIHARITVANEWVQVMALLKLVTACAKLAKNNPEQSTLEVKWSEYKRKLRSQRLLEKVESRKLADMLDIDYVGFLLEFE